MTASSKPPPGKPAGTYSRFIPREELGSFAAWDPDTLNGDLDDGLGETQAAPTEVPGAQALAAAARQAGYQDGYRDGLAALDSFKQSFARQMAAQVGVLVGNFHDQFDALEAQMAQALANASVMLARRVVRSELLAHPEQVAHAAQQAVNAVLLSAGHIRITVNPADLALVAEGAAEALQARGARLLGDAAIERGGVLVESDLGRIDARIQTRWQQAAAVLGSELPWTDGGAPDEAL